MLFESVPLYLAVHDVFCGLVQRVILPAKRLIDAVVLRVGHDGSLDFDQAAQVIRRLEMAGAQGGQHRVAIGRANLRFGVLLLLSRNIGHRL